MEPHAYFLIKENNNYYSIKEENYDESTNKFIPNLIFELFVNTFNDYGMGDLFY